MLLKQRVVPLRALFLLALAVIVALLPAATTAAAQAAVSGQIQPLNGSTVSGTMTVSAGDQGIAVVGVNLSGFVPRTVFDVNVYHWNLQPAGLQGRGRVHAGCGRRGAGIGRGAGVQDERVGDARSPS